MTIIYLHQTQQYSRLTAVSTLRDNSWEGLWDHTGCWAEAYKTNAIPAILSSSSLTHKTLFSLSYLGYLFSGIPHPHSLYGCGCHLSLKLPVNWWLNHTFEVLWVLFWRLFRLVCSLLCLQPLELLFQARIFTSVAVYIHCITSKAWLSFSFSSIFSLSKLTVIGFIPKFIIS